jgi:hypothetical protein
MRSKLKVYGGGLGGTLRVVVAATSWMSVLRLLNEQGANVSAGFLRDYWSITGNPEEVAMALSDPGRVFKKPNTYTGTEVWAPLKEKL